VSHRAPDRLERAAPTTRFRTTHELERELAMRERQVLSLQAEVRRLVGLLPREVRKSHPGLTRREKVALNGSRHP
jgi:hypothetical protein